MGGNYWVKASSRGDFGGIKTLQIARSGSWAMGSWGLPDLPSLSVSSVSPRQNYFKIFENNT